jgi:predicted aspartyl protease
MAIQNYFNFNIIRTSHPSNPGQDIINVQTDSGAHALYSGGLIIDMVVGIDYITSESLHKQGQKAPIPVVIRALLDTGCTKTAIDLKLVESLNLKPISYSKVHTANGAVDVTNHLVSIGFPGTGLKGKILHEVGSANLAGQTFQALIGRDVMSSWVITYNGIAGFVSIAD